MICAGEYLEASGYTLVDNTDDADFVILPIPVKDYMLTNLEGKLVFYGVGDYHGFDYNKNESFLLENAYLTSEGAVALLKESTERSIYDSDILITGYGRIARALHKALSAMGARIIVCCRSESDRTQAVFNGARVIGFDELKEDNTADFIFNTVPHLVFTKQELDRVRSGAIIIDLASFPGGVDTLYCKSKKITLIDGKRLPSRYSSLSAGRLIGKTVENIIKEDLS